MSAQLRLTTTVQRQGSGAVLSADQRYRYRLWRHWGPGHRIVCFIMLNPSTADHTEDDPTIRRCIGFAKSWGYDGIVVVNQHAFRATNPNDLPASRAQAIGPENDRHLVEVARDADLVVAAWGARGDRAWVPDLLWGEGVDLYHLGLTKAGQPRHPLYLRGDTQPQLWREGRRAEGAGR